MRNLRTYEIAKEFYRQLQNVKAPRYLKEQLNRASSSIALNLAESYGRLNKGDQRRFFKIAFGSLRECEAILDLLPSTEQALKETADKLAAHTFKLIQKTA